MNQIQNIGLNKAENTQAETRQNVSYDEIVDELICQGLPQAFNPNNFLSKISTEYNISEKDARNCLKLAIKELEQTKQQKVKKEVSNEVEVFAQSGYFYPRETKAKISQKQDGMDSLNSFGCYNKLMFGIK